MTRTRPGATQTTLAIASIGVILIIAIATAALINFLITNGLG